MNQCNNTLRKIGSVFVAMCLVVSMLPIDVFADDSSAKPNDLKISCSDEKVVTNKMGINCYVIGSKDEDEIKLDVSQTPQTASNEVTWSSDKESNGITVDKNGLVKINYTGTSPINTTIKAVSKVDSNISAEYKIYILPLMEFKYGDSLTIDLPEDGTLPKEEKYFKLNPEEYSNYELVEWLTDDTDKISLNPTNTVCFVTPIKPGKATVKVKNKSNNKNNLEATVNVKGVAVFSKENERSKSLLPNQTVDLIAYTESSDEAITWSSSNENCVKVDQNGKVTAIKEGNALITATSSNGKKGGFKVLVKQSEDKPYLENLQITNYYTYKDWKDSNFSPTQFDYKLSTKSASNYTVNLGLKPIFDLDEYKVELYQDDKLVEEISKDSSSKTASLKMNPGDNKVVVRLVSLKDESKYTDYNFDVNRTRSSAATLSKAYIKPSNRELLSSPLYNNKKEGTLFRLNNNGELTTSTGVFSSCYNYKSFLYNDADSFKFSAVGTNPYAKLRVTVGDEKPYILEANTYSEEIKFNNQKSVDVKLEICSDKTYNDNLEKNQEEPFVAEKTYTFTAVRTDINEDKINLTEIQEIKITDATWCTPGFNKKLPSASILINKGKQSTNLNIKVGEGSKVYQERVSDSNLIAKNEDGTYTITATPTSFYRPLKVIIVNTLENGDTLTSSYDFTIYAIGNLMGMPDAVVDFICPGSQYSNQANYGMYPEKSLVGSGNWYSPISLGNFGGYITYQYKNGIKNDPKNPYGIDFTVFGNSNGGAGFSEPGNVMVSKDGNTWYTLAGSEHYDKTSIWNYQLTYKNTGSGCAYEDSLGNSGDMSSMYKYSAKDNYPLYKWNSDDDSKFTVNGVLLTSDAEDPFGSSQALYPDFGYADVHTNSKTVAGTGENVDLLTTPVGNPYTGNYNNYGDGFDLDWAVDDNGYPVKLDEINYIKVQTASFIMSGAIGEKSTEVNAVTATQPKEESVGKTSQPTSITVGTKEIDLKDGVYTYDVSAKDNFDVNVVAGDDTNVYINNQRGNTRTYQTVPKKGIVRIILQEGEKEPIIYYLKVKEGEEKTKITFNLDNGEESVIKEVSTDEALDYTPENPEKEGYTFVGWYENVDDITTEYKSGQTYTNNIVYTAKYAHQSMLDAQAKDIVNNVGGIKFKTILYTDTDEILEKGTLILPTNLLEGKLTLTTPRIAKSQAKYIFERNIEEKYETYLGTLVNIPKSQFDREITASSYVKYKDKSGHTYTVYTPYGKSVTVNQLLKDK